MKKYLTITIVGALFFHGSFPQAVYAKGDLSVERYRRILELVPAKRSIDSLNVLERATALLKKKEALQVKYYSLPSVQRAQISESNLLSQSLVIHRIMPRPASFRARQKKPSVRYIVATAYSSTRDQTDSDPCTTASGYNVCTANQENVIAANFLPIGTRVRFPDHFGERVFVVEDRMHPRFSSRVDFWMKSRHAAKQFGIRKLRMEIIEDHLAMQ